MKYDQEICMGVYNGHAEQVQVSRHTYETKQ